MRLHLLQHRLRRPTEARVIIIRIQLQREIPARFRASGLRQRRSVRGGFRPIRAAPFRRAVGERHRNRQATGRHQRRFNPHRHHVLRRIATRLHRHRLAIHRVSARHHARPQVQRLARLPQVREHRRRAIRPRQYQRDLAKIQPMRVLSHPLGKAPPGRVAKSCNPTCRPHRVKEVPAENPRAVFPAASEKSASPNATSCSLKQKRLATLKCPCAKANSPLPTCKIFFGSASVKTTLCRDTNACRSIAIARIRIRIRRPRIVRAK